FGHGACAEQNDEGRHARKCTYRLKVGAVTGKLALNLIYSTKPLREGSSGQSQTKQEKTLSLPANQPIALTKLSLNISPDDRVKIVVTVSDGQSLHLSQQWPPSSEKS
ncbi:curli assembly chaperone CsgC, partial [Escherichia coli]|uniref:curli assembly chaperone CsgC n=1 Tax=Escherichia coli TaxID=562 RepID=UPI003859ED58